MKLIIQIPCLNEREALPNTLAELPKRVDGFDVVEWMVIDDGSTDGTAEVALDCGVQHVIRLGHNRGLARAFTVGLEAAVRLGADVVVNTDADNQYRAEDIPLLTAPILRGEADIVVGARPIASIAHFSLAKRWLQRLGSAVVRSLSGVSISDAVSGFRAFSREAAQRLNVFDRHTYTIETLIQAGQSNLRVADVPVRITGPTRDSRLVKSVPSYVARSIVTIVSAYVIYRPVRTFGILAFAFLVPGAFLAARYLWLAYVVESGGSHVQSVIAAAVLALWGVLMLGLALTAHLLAINRRLLEELKFEARRQESVRPPVPHEQQVTKSPGSHHSGETH